MDSHRGVAQPWDRRPHEPGRRHCHHRRVASRYEGKHVKHRQQTEGVLGGRQIHSRPPAPRRRASSPASNTPPKQTRVAHARRSPFTANAYSSTPKTPHAKFSSYRLKSTPGVPSVTVYSMT